MADMQDTSQTITDSFIKGLNKDSDPSYVTDGMWTHAVNMVNNSKTGKVGSISNEAANYICFNAGTFMPSIAVEKLVIGAIYLFSDKWVIFTAGHNANGQPVSSEIGLFEEEQCSYKPIVIDACLNFDKRYLISGVSRLKEDCTWQVYWGDGLNPDRYLNVGDPQTWPGPDYSYITSIGANANYYQGPGGTKILWPNVQWVEKCEVVNDCNICENTNKLDCEHIRLARLMTTPCLNLTRGQQGGTLANGTYFALIAYTIKGQKVTDYFAQSNYQFIYSPQDLQGSLTLNISADNVNFDEFQLVIVKCVNQQTVAQLMGIYSTNTSTVSIDQIDNGANITIPLEQLPLQTPVFETSDQIAEVNNYLLRVGPRSKFDFNYQPLANLIRTKWASVEYPADYYMKGGNKTNYMRDEVYSFFIRWVYNTGDKTSTYHIPGRPPKNFNVPNGVPTLENAELTGNQNTLYSDDKVFEVYNTATIDNSSSVVGTFSDDGGKVIATGDMGYWESTEKYPDNRPDIWNPSAHCWTGQQAVLKPEEFDLCGKYIRHHKFPEDYAAGSTADTVTHFRRNPNPINNTNQFFIRLMGVYFENVALPKDNDGNDIPGIVGFEILRGSREGNKTIVAKGMVNNLRTYQVPGSGTNSTTGLYPNYPFNTIKPLSNTLLGHVAGYNDPFIRAGISNDPDFVYTQTVPEDIFSFHSPDTMMTTPFLSTTEFKTYGQLSGYSQQNFNTPSDHPKFKLLSDVIIVPMLLAGLAEAIIASVGKRTGVSKGPAYQSIVVPDVQGTKLEGGGGGSLVNTLYLGTGEINTKVSDISGGKITTEDEGIEVSKPDDFEDVLDDLNGTPLQPGALDAQNTFAAISKNIAAGGGKYENVYIDAANDGKDVLGGIYTSQEIHSEWNDSRYLPDTLKALNNVKSFAYYFSEGMRVTLDLIYALTGYKQQALQQKAYGFYSNIDKNLNTDTTRFKMEDGFYLRDNIQTVSRYQDHTGAWKSYNINNIKRSPKVIVRTKAGNNQNIGPKLLLLPGDKSDKSLTTLGTLIQTNPISLLPVGTKLPDFKGNIDRTFSLPIRSHYGAIRGRVRNQYGQLDSIKQLPVGTCEQKLSDYTINSTTLVCNSVNIIKNTIYRTPLMFGGDTYINRYTEKDTMCFFFDWLYDQPDGFEYNYYLRSMIPNPRFRLNSRLYDAQDLAGALKITNIIGYITGTNTFAPGEGILPTDFYNLDYFVDKSKKYNYSNDKAANYPGFFTCKDSYFYLGVSSIRDFFVESEVLVDFRTQPEEIARKYYNPYNFTDYNAMFDTNPNIYGVNSYNQYDYSLSVSKLYNQYFSLGSVQNRYYDPNVADLCFTYYPNRIIYSLPQQDEAIKDSWFVYLVNNYKAFKSHVSGVKSINKSGLIITFKNDSPMMYQGVDSQPLDSKLLTPNGWKTMGEITINDKVIGRDGKIHNILNVYEIGDKPIYRVYFKDGSSVRASDTHHWNILNRHARCKSYKTYLKEVTKSTLELNYKLHNRDAIPTPDPIEFTHNDYIISPYVLGALIADGCMTKGTPNITCNDKEIIERIKLESKCTGEIIERLNDKNNTISYKLDISFRGVQRRKNSNIFTQELNKLKLYKKKSENKFIPNNYLFGTSDQRFALLQGLLDCDGTISRDNKISYSTISKTLADDVVNLVHSLGGLAKIDNYTKQNTSGKFIVEYRVRIRMKINPFYLFRKSNRFKVGNDLVVRTINNVVYEGIEQARCIKTDAPDELYITDNYILTHNTLQTDLGTKVTLGDGGLFSQAPQQLSNADKPYEYGASQNRLSVISTPVGIFYMSQAAGKIFSVGEGLQEISQQGMKWWFTLFLPYKLTQDFPLYPYQDNPVAGIGCQAVFDNTNTILYFCKKDYELKDKYKGKVTYIPLKGDSTGDYFIINGNTTARFKLGDPILFRDASWTISYDPKNQFWISFHDWHPDLFMPTKDVFISTKGTGGWRHNWICDKYCNYYGIDYACEIDVPITTGQAVTTTRSVEYIMEAYRKTDNCVDSYHVLDYNFDTAVVYNSEQVSGYLNLNIYPKNDLALTRQFPRLNPTTLTSFDILFSKEENKYRFNQFWDITKDRGEFPIGTAYPAGQGPYVPGTTTLIGNYSNLNTWITEPDGFRRVLNQNNLNYAKPELQRKKFRHYMSFINFKKNISGNTNIVLKIDNSKNEISLR